MKKLLIFLSLFFAVITPSYAAPAQDTLSRYINLSWWSYEVIPPEFYSIQFKIITGSWTFNIYDDSILVGYYDNSNIDYTYIINKKLILEWSWSVQVELSYVPYSYDPSGEIIMTQDFIATFYMWQSVATLFVFILVFIFKIIQKGTP